MIVRALDLSAIKIGKYQKKLNKARAAAIAANYDSHRMRPIDVSFRNGEFYCFDGQTRMAAYRILGYTRIPAIIHEGLTYEEEALLFAKQQENVGAVLSSHKWNALVEAEDPATMKTVEVAEKNGFKVSGSVSSATTIAAVKTLQDIVIESGFDGLDDVLSVIGTAWNDQEVYNKSKKLLIAPTNVNIIEGVYIFMKEYKDKRVLIKIASFPFSPQQSPRRYFPGLTIHARGIHLAGWQHLFWNCTIVGSVLVIVSQISLETYKTHYYLRIKPGKSGRITAVR
jgi:hypothetical protein